MGESGKSHFFHLRKHDHQHPDRPALFHTSVVRGNWEHMWNRWRFHGATEIPIKCDFITDGTKCFMEHICNYFPEAIGGPGKFPNWKIKNKKKSFKQAWLENIFLSSTLLWGRPLVKCVQGTMWVQPAFFSCPCQMHSSPESCCPPVSGTGGITGEPESQSWFGSETSQDSKLSMMWLLSCMDSGLET